MPTATTDKSARAKIDAMDSSIPPVYLPATQLAHPRPTQFEDSLDDPSICIPRCREGCATSLYLYSFPCIMDITKPRALRWEDEPRVLGCVIFIVLKMSLITTCVRLATSKYSFPRPKLASYLSTVRLLEGDMSTYTYTPPRRYVCLVPENPHKGRTHMSTM